MTRPEVQLSTPAVKIIPAKREEDTMSEARKPVMMPEKNVDLEESSERENVDSTSTLLEENYLIDGKRHQVYSDGSKRILFPNGTIKTIRADGHVNVSFPNNDTKDVYPDGTVVYFYAEANTTQTTKPDGTRIYRFGDQNQVEKHFADGSKSIHFAGACILFF